MKYYKCRIASGAVPQGREKVLNAMDQSTLFEAPGITVTDGAYSPSRGHIPYRTSGRQKR